MRAKTSHTYDEGTALDVVAGLADFIKEVEYLYHQILDRIQALPLHLHSKSFQITGY